MSKILFVDDDPNRCKQFTRAMIGHQVFIAKDAGEACALLALHRFDLVSLDHDLIGVYQPHGSACGCAVVDFLTRQALHKGSYPQTIILHTFNRDAVSLMQRDARKIATLTGDGTPWVRVTRFGSDAYREAVGGDWE